MKRGRLHSFRTRGTVYGITPRLLVLAFAAAGAFLLIPFALWQGVAIVAATVALMFPRSMAAWGAAGCLAFGVMLSEPSPWRTALAMLLVHAMHVFGSLSLMIPLTSRLQAGVLLPSLVRMLMVQLLAQPLVFGVWLLVPPRGGQGVAWLAPLAAAMLLVGVVIALRTMKRVDRPPASVPADDGALSVRGANVRGPS